ncbi:hypothetical protein [Wolbachia endosymbiont of Oedothorax gibbosus]|uniref:hypothetical protein n=1 Tax=Wolbachia endosymbiont of Oedothorax gibbosus TaxID=931100 RepID=UPI00202457E8|nr:hypothetical protein [Wolbachia endosymbiont of Oedothorax gibbosus]
MIQKIIIDFHAIREPMSKDGKVIGDAHYLERVQEFVDANLVQELIYENLKKEEHTYQNLQDIQRQLSEEKPPQLPPKSENSNVDAKPLLPLKKRKLNKVHTDSGVAVNGKNKEQVYTKNISLREQHEADHRYYIPLDLKTDMQKLHSSLQEDHFSKKAIYVICSLFKEKVIRAIRERGDEVPENSENEFTIESTDHYGDYSKITVDSLTQIMAQVQKKKKEIKDLASNYKGEDNQLRQEISELLNVNLQKTDINSNYATRNPSERQQAASSPRRYIKVTQDKNTGNNTSERDKREKGKKTDLRSKILRYVPWRTAKKGVEEKGKLIQSFDNPVYSHGIELNGDKKEVSSAKQPVEGSKVEAELKRRASAESQKQSAER